MSKQGRPEETGVDVANGIIGTVHLFYQRTTAIKFLKSLIDSLQIELSRRIKEAK